MSRTAFCMSLAILCWGTGVRGDDARPGSSQKQVKPPVNSSEQGAVEKGERIRETVRDVVEKGLQRAESSQADFHQQLADCLLIQNREEINLARFAVEHAQNSRVKEFAQKMITDHEEFGRKLKPFAAHADKILETNRLLPQTTQITPATPLPAKDRDEPALRVEGKQGGRIEVHASKVIQGSSSEDWFQMEQTAAQNCQKMTRDCLSKMDPAQFDQAYLGSQIGMHIGLLARLQAADGYVSGDLQQVLKDAQHTVQTHRSQAEDLYRDLTVPQHKTE